MIMEVSDTFSFEAKAKSDAADPAVQRWENLMSNYQQHLSFAPANTKWVLMDRILSSRNFLSISLERGEPKCPEGRYFENCTVWYYFAAL